MFMKQKGAMSIGAIIFIIIILLLILYYLGFLKIIF